MSYTRPLATQADATWLGKAEYTPLSGLDADATWAQVAFPATGTKLISYGVHSLYLEPQTGVAESTLPVQFGQARLAQTFQAQSHLLNPTFGTPTAALRLNAQTTGKLLTLGKPLALGVPQVGRPKGFQLDSVVGYAHCYFPAKITTRDQTAVTGFKLTNFGQASSPYQQSCEARETPLEPLFGVAQIITGRLMLFGTHGTARAQAAAAIHATAFGEHTRAERFKVTSTRPANFGSPTVNQGHVVTGYGRVRFGRHISRQRGFRATGLRVGGRIGWPTCTATFPGCKVSGFKAPAFGTHNANHQYRALHIWPQTRFGCPLMKRFI